MGTFKFRCVFCRQRIEAQDEWDGMFAECPGCGRRIEIRCDDEFVPMPPHTRLAPVPPVPDTPVPPSLHPTFQKPFPPKMQHTARPVLKSPVAPKADPIPPAIPEDQDRKEKPAAPPEPKTPAAEKTAPPPPAMPEDRVREEKPAAPPIPEAPKPFPKPFTIDLPKWELPGKDGTKK